MKKTNVKVELKWRHCSATGPNSYEAVAGNYTANIDGKKYTIWAFSPTNFMDFAPVFEAKSRSVKDSFERAGKKLMKYAMSDSTPNPTFKYVGK